MSYVEVHKAQSESGGGLVAIGFGPYCRCVLS